MAQVNERKLLLQLVLLSLCICACAFNAAQAKRLNANLTSCQHLRRVETRRAKALYPNEKGLAVRIPRCNKSGDFEEIQCRNERAGLDCWCIDEYGVEIPGTHNESKSGVRCAEPAHCPASACRMFCPAGFARDPETGCSICRCRDPCEGVACPNGQTCQPQEVKCKIEPCPPVPTCKKARSMSTYCPAGTPLAIEGSIRPFLCGNESGKPQCPPLYQCMVEAGNEYGVCCPSTVKFSKPGICPAQDKVEYSPSTGYMCGSPCNSDLECGNMEKCCFTKGCQFNCQQPFNVTTCHQARALSDILAVNEREGRGYQPDCNGPGGLFTPRQCSRNGLVCWCVDPRTGHKIQGTMGPANEVNCDGWENMISHSLARSFNMEKCDTNICAAVCEYGFKNDHNGCPSCECSEPCEGFKCSIGSHCEVATDPLCESGSALCASWPVCKPDLVYSNPCDVGAPLADNNTGEVMYCFEERQSRAFQPTAFFEPGPDMKQARSMTNRITCPNNYKCVKLPHDTESVCCPTSEEAITHEEQTTHQQTMCEYLRDFSERMEGTEEGMQLAIPAPHCTDDGNYFERQCTMKKIRVTRAEQRQILEQNTIRRMRMLLKSANERQARGKRQVERLKLYRVNDDALKVHIAAPIQSRNAKVIDVGADRAQSLGQLFEVEFKKVLPALKQSLADNELVEIEVEECWCVDSFGTEIPSSRGFNITDADCANVRESIDCLDLTCRMGCEYGFTLDPNTRCPACQCRDPCDGVVCGDGKECRIVDVSCDEEYCPPVPACLPRKPGQCPFLVPPGPDNLDANTCSYECRTDSHCEGHKRCCSNGCGTQCVLPQMKTACQHLNTIQMHQASELGIPAMKMHIAQCDARTGKWNQVQCSPNGYCWCVDEKGWVVAGTRVKGSTPICEINSTFACAQLSCDKMCEAGYKMDKNGCPLCECRDFCDEISCSNGEECQLINVECIDEPCPKMPICVPRRVSVCPEGNPLQQGDLEVSCGPHNDNEACPTTHTCQLNPVTHRGVCCSKTRDVCFESMDKACLANLHSQRNVTRYRFSPKSNRCLPVTINLDATTCQTKNLFHSELACNSVCPVLTSCERLKLKNNLAAQHSGYTSVWFQPRCDPVTGHWSPVQCLGAQPSLHKESTKDLGRASKQRPTKVSSSSSTNGVCWCADKKGAPLKGTLTRDVEPVCNSRQGRQSKAFNVDDQLMEEVIRQMTTMVEIEEYELEERAEKTQDAHLGANTYSNRNGVGRSLDDNMAVESEYYETPVGLKPKTSAIPNTAAEAYVTEHILALANSLLDSQLSIEALKPMPVETTRCRALSETAAFPVSCDEHGAFLPTQCNSKTCWCVDAAGNQLDTSHMFRPGTSHCSETPIASVAIELHMVNRTSRNIRNAYDTIRRELYQLLGDAVENLRVQENFDGSVIVRFELHNEEKIDLAFAIESAINANRFNLVGGHFTPDISRSHFIHRSVSSPVTAAVPHESTIQVVLFIMATSSAFLVSIFVVYVMLKRGKRTKVLTDHYGYPVYPDEAVSKTMGGGDKAVDFTAPIFVLSSHEHNAENAAK
uniref:Papilin n=2 Tax=Ceratitis capitata TaxID=7213 RepID=W8AHA0_CERCA